MTRNTDPINDPVIKAIKKYEYHPSIIKVRDNIKDGTIFSFDYVSLAAVEKEIYALDKSEAIQQSDIPTRIINENKDIFTQLIANNFNINLSNSDFPNALKNADIKPVLKRLLKQIKLITDQLAYYPIYQKSTKDVSIIKCIISLNLFFPNISVGLGKAIVLNTT